MRIQTAFIIGATLLTVACNSLSAADDVPAVISQPSAASRTELLDVVTGALGGAQILLADDALTASSLLTIERNPPGDLQGRQFTGRLIERPVQFNLVKNGSECILEERSTGKRWHLTQTSCRPE